MQNTEGRTESCFKLPAPWATGAAICQTLARDGLRVIVSATHPFRFRDEWLALQRAAGFDFMSEEHEISDDSTFIPLLEKISREIGPVEVLVGINAEMTTFQQPRPLRQRTEEVSGRQHRDARRRLPPASGVGIAHNALIASAFRDGFSAISLWATVSVTGLRGK